MGGLSGAYGSGDTWINSITLVPRRDARVVDRRTAQGLHSGRHQRPLLSFGPGAPAPALSPEADKVEAKLAAVVAYRDQHLPGKPVWWTEFRDDTFAKSPLHAPALGSNSALIVQAQWLVRNLLAALEAGLQSRHAVRARRHVHAARGRLRYPVRDVRAPRLSRLLLPSRRGTSSRRSARACRR